MIKDNTRLQSHGLIFVEFKCKLYDFAQILDSKGWIHCCCISLSVNDKSKRCLKVPPQLRYMLVFFLFALTEYQTFVLKGLDGSSIKEHIYINVNLFSW